MAHVVVTEGLADEAFIRERCDWDEYQDWARFVSDERHSPETLEAVTRVPASDVRAAAHDRFGLGTHLGKERVDCGRVEFGQAHQAAAHDFVGNGGP